MMFGIVLSCFGLPGSFLIATVTTSLAIFSGFDLVGVSTVIVAFGGALIAEGISFVVRNSYYRISLRKKSIVTAMVAITVLVFLLTPIIYVFGTVLGVLFGSLAGVLYGELSVRKSSNHFLRIKKTAIFRELSCMAFRGTVSALLVLITLTSIYS